MGEYDHGNKSRFQCGESKVYWHSLLIKIDPGGSLGMIPNQHIEWECVGWLPHTFAHIQEYVRK